jgi:cytoskeletal protein CcmA (bactofilin family)
MTEKQLELEKLISRIDDLHYIYKYHRVEKSEAEYLQILEKANENNRQTLAAIKEILESGIDLTFRTINNWSVMYLAVPRDNVELIEMLISYGVSMYGDRGEYYSPLRRAAEFGAVRVVKFLIEEKGINPRGTGALSEARSSRFSGDVLPYLIETMKKTKSERLPPPKKAYELTEENLVKWLSQIRIPVHSSAKLHDIVESLFIEGYSIPISNFYETIEEQDPELVFACIALITNATTSEPKDKVVKNISKDIYVHHGNLVVKGDLKIRSLMVTGNLTVNGHASNVQGRRLFVGGDFECESMYTEGPVIIGGNLKAKKIGTFYNDYALEVKQTLQADTLIIDHHRVIANHFEVKERIEK